MENLSDTVKERRFKMLGHIWRMQPERHCRIALNWMPIDGKRRLGRPVTMWRRTVAKDLKEMGVDWVQAKTITMDRGRRRKIVAAQCPTSIVRKEQQCGPP